MTELEHTPSRRRMALPAKRFALGVATGFLLAIPLLSACGGQTDNLDVVSLNKLTVDQHLYLKGPDGTKFEISVGKDASGKDVVAATPVGK
jgi:hypothetical protein